MSDQIDIKVSESLVNGIIESKVQTAIVEALSEDDGIVERVIASALNFKVNEEGKRSSYGNDYTYLQYLCKTVVQEAAKNAITRWAEERKEVLENEFLKQLQTKKMTSLIVRACADGLVKATSCNWRFDVNINERR